MDILLIFLLVAIVVILLWIISSIGLIEEESPRKKNKQVYEILVDAARRAISSTDPLAREEHVAGLKAKIEEIDAPIGDVLLNSALDSIVAGSLAQDHYHMIRKTEELYGRDVAGEMYVGNLEAHHDLNTTGASKPARKALKKARRKYLNLSTGKANT
ncbi:hypothetical protein HOD83_03170 [Candidatus Woesearchaeota archaeon]|jgi:hypothetical protein|nr:hypothetical protein [Candidatus Woesearchaeota archaeon]MBT4114092.1 hypothetical protein [Candidatus Woesearchaeota archaeon]MBT4248559.1 hypothetical protein [Candidatus Woesearchaeota archaeon]